MSDLDSMINEEPVKEGPKLDFSQINIEALVSEFRDLRDDLDLRRKEFKEHEQGVKDRMDVISMQLREIADTLGLTSLTTKAGTAYKTVKKYYRVGNWDSILEWIKSTDNFQMLEKRIGKLATQEIHESSGVLPPGVEYSAEIEIVVRKNAP